MLQAVQVAAFARGPPAMNGPVTAWRRRKEATQQWGQAPGGGGGGNGRWAALPTNIRRKILLLVLQCVLLAAVSLDSFCH